MHVKRTAGIVLGGGAIAAWLAGAATSNRALPDPIVPAPAPIDARGADLAGEIARLHERLRPEAAPRTPGRNLFAFRAAAAPREEPPARPPVLTEPPAAAPAAGAMPMKLSGIAEDATPDASVVRTAFISAGGQFYMVKEGEPVTARFRVAVISADAVELIDLTDNSTRRLVMK